MEEAMKYWKGYLGLVLLLLSLTSLGFSEDFDLQYFLAKSSSKESGLSTEERTEMLNRINGVIEEAQRFHRNLVQAIQNGDVMMGYQEGRFWMSKLEGDRGSIETGIQQLKLLREKPTDLIAAIQLNKSLKDLSPNLNAYNNMPLFSAFVGDLAPELELWADPIFYKLYLLPLAHLKDAEKIPPQKEKKPIPKGKKP